MTDVNRLIVPQIPNLRRYARALIGNPDGADDLVQDTLERALSRAHSWRPGSNMRAWLFTIMHNVHVNRLRGENRRPASVAFDETRGEPTARPAQEDGLALDNLADALAALPEDQRAAVLLVGLEGLAYADAAAVLDIPVGTLMSRLSRGLSSLKRILQRRFDHGEE